MFRLIATIGFIGLVCCQVALADTCKPGTVSVAVADDGLTASILFSDMAVSTIGSQINKNCRYSAVLPVSENYSYGVVKVDYRGFYSLPSGAKAKLQVQPIGFSHAPLFHRQWVGGAESGGEFFVTQTLGAGHIKWSSCGQSLNLAADVNLELRNSSSESAAISLDSADGGLEAGVHYKIHFRKCP